MQNCCLCNKKIEGYGNNPAPLNDTGICCDKCNHNKVIPERIKMIEENSNNQINHNSEEVIENANIH